VIFRDDLLQDKVILVTGGGTGLGRKMAETFARLGAKLALVGRRAEVLEQARAEMEAQNLTVWVQPLDIRLPDAVDQVMDNIFAHYGKLDVLVNNAAGNFISPMERLSTRAVDAVINIVLHGTMYCTLAAGKRWIARGEPGTVLNITTTYAWTGSGYVVPSAVAKAGVLAMTRSLATEWARYRIRQVAIAPGPFPTEGAWSRLMPTEELANAAQMRVPLKRVGRPEELTTLAAYLVSDAAAYINGEVVTIDGGEWLYGAGMFNSLDRLTQDDWDRVRELMPKKASKTVPQ
jgi:NAD(P)-dependent dehydrogenase (short-subunit alcohol dehydrogenase family)